MAFLVTGTAMGPSGCSFGRTVASSECDRARWAQPDPRIKSRARSVLSPAESVARSGGGSFRVAEVTPGGRKLPDADGAADLLGGHADRLGEGRVGELHLGELLDVHARTHGGRDDLDGFGRVFAEHMGAEN